MNPDVALAKLDFVRGFRLIYFYDAERNAGSHIDCIREALVGGAGAVVFRDKSSTFENYLAAVQEVMPLIREFGAGLFVVDNPYVAVAASAHGVLLEQDGIPSAVARDILGEAGYIGLAVHSREETAEALRHDVDMLLLGPCSCEIDNKQLMDDREFLWSAMAAHKPVFAYGHFAAVADVRKYVKMHACGVAYIPTPNDKSIREDVEVLVREVEVAKSII